MSTKRNPGKKAFSVALASIAAALFFCAIAGSSQDVPDGNASAAESTADMLFMLLQIQADIQGDLNDLDSDLANASHDLSATDLEGADASEVLVKLLDINPNIVDAVTFSRDGRSCW